jgi:hypothetical protein
MEISRRGLEVGEHGRRNSEAQACGSRLRVSAAWSQPTATVQSSGTYQAFEQFHSATGGMGRHGKHSEYSMSMT